MAAAAGILNLDRTSALAQTGTTASPMAAAASGTSSASSDSATISANDFLTLLVTEMKNQDPTASTDPNQYINQLVNVNSLQQLISINQTLTTDLGSSATGASGTPTAHAVASTGSPINASAQAQPALTGITVPGAINAAASKLAPGNLAVPPANIAAQNVAQALSGRTHVQ